MYIRRLFRTEKMYMAKNYTKVTKIILHLFGQRNAVKILMGSYFSPIKVAKTKMISSQS